MSDPQAGNEARDLWNGVQQARQEAAAYREVFAKPEEARAAAARASALEEIDAAFFGAAGKSPQEISAGRTALAQRMLREDPAAFREMVFAGLRALQDSAQDSNLAPRLLAQSEPGAASLQVPAPDSHAQQAQLAAYTAFEKSANEELERQVSGSIQRALEHAFPVAQTILSVRPGVEDPAQARLPALRARLASAVREDVEASLKSDQQLAEQLGRILAARRFDETTRTQVVRLINDRAQQLVPIAARRVIQDWTQTTFAAHRGKGLNVAPGFSPASGDPASAAQPRSLSAAFGNPPRPAGADPAISAKATAANRAERDAGLTPRSTARPYGRLMDYNRLTDEQILDL
jgi:hypothetical protein